MVNKDFTIKAAWYSTEEDTVSYVNSEEKN